MSRFEYNGATYVTEDRPHTLGWCLFRVDNGNLVLVSSGHWSDDDARAAAATDPGTEPAR